jgi:hypothetical protein
MRDILLRSGSKAPSLTHAGVTEGAIEMIQPTLTGDWRYMGIVAK